MIKTIQQNKTRWILLFFPSLLIEILKASLRCLKRSPNVRFRRIEAQVRTVHSKRLLR